MAHMGQKTLNNTKYSPEKADKLIELLSQGRFKTHACALVGIHIKTLYNWIEADEKNEHGDWPGFQGFAGRVKKAEAQYCERAELHLIELAKSGKNPDWKAEAWMLEKKYPKLYGEMAKQIEISGKLDVGLPDLIKAMEDAENAEKEE